MAHQSTLTLEQAALDLLRPILQEILSKDTKGDRSNNDTSIAQEEAEQSLTNSPTQAVDSATVKEPAEIPVDSRDNECNNFNYSIEDLLATKKKNEKSTKAQIFFNVSFN